MQSHSSIIARTVKTKDYLIIVDEHRVQEILDQPLLAINIRDALDEMRELLEKNLEIAAYVYGTEDGMDADDLSDSQLRALLEQMGVELPDNALTREEMMDLLDQVAIE